MTEYASVFSVDRFQRASKFSNGIMPSSHDLHSPSRNNDFQVECRLSIFINVFVHYVQIPVFRSNDILSAISVNQVSGVCKA